MFHPMTDAQHQKLLDLAMQPATARKLIQKIEAIPNGADALWDVLCIAILTAGYP